MQWSCTAESCIYETSQYMHVLLCMTIALVDGYQLDSTDMPCDAGLLFP